MKEKLEKKVEIILEYLGLNKAFVPECGGDFTPRCDTECKYFSQCEKETDVRMVLEEVEK